MPPTPHTPFAFKTGIYSKQSFFFHLKIFPASCTISTSWLCSLWKALSHPRILSPRWTEGIQQSEQALFL